MTFSTHWVRDQQLRLLGLVYRTLLDSGLNAERRFDLQVDIAHRIAQLMPLPNNSGLSFQTIEVLSSISPSEWNDYDLDSVGQAVAWMRDALKSSAKVDLTLQSHALVLLNQGHISTIDFLKWAERASPDRVSSGHSWCAGRWRRYRAAINSQAEANADQWLAAVRSADTLIERVSAVGKFYETMCGLFDPAETDPALLWLCHAWLGQQFVWPLLALSAGSKPVGVSLPLSLSFVPRQIVGSKHQVRFEAEGAEYRFWSEADEEGSVRWHSFVGNEEALLWRDDFRQSIVQSFSAAKRLWLRQNGRLDENSRSALWKKALRIDWTYALLLAQAMPQGLPCKLDGLSASLYFTQAILSMLLRTAAPIGAATGIVNPRSGRYTIEWVGDIPAKVSYAKNAGIFSRLVLPRRAHKELSQELRGQLEQSGTLGQMEVNYCQTAIDAADAMQRTGWRRAVFVQCPEIGHDFFLALRRLHQPVAQVHAPKHDDEVLPAFGHLPDDDADESFVPPLEQWQVDALWAQTNTWLGAAGQREQRLCVRRVAPSDLHPNALGTWLAWLDHLVRTNPYWRGTGLGILCIRISRDDNEMRVWERIFEALEVNPGLMRDFQWSTLGQAERSLAMILNNFSCDPVISSSPPPDLLVLVDDARWVDSPTNTTFPSDFRGQFARLFEVGHRGSHFGAMLQQREDGGAREEVLGATRVMVFIPDKSKKPAQAIWRTAGAQRGLVLSDDQRCVLDAVKAFRSAFPASAAVQVVNSSRREGEQLDYLAVRSLLDELKSAHMLGYFRGEYYVRWATLSVPDGSISSPLLNLAAAGAWAPIVSPTKVGNALNRDSIFESRAIDEARWHLRQAARQLGYRSPDLLRQCSEYSFTLLTLLPFTDWDLVRSLIATRSREGALDHAVELVTELLEAEESVRVNKPLGGHVHPSRHALAIEVLGHRLGMRPEPPPEHQEILVALAKKWFKQAESVIHLMSIDKPEECRRSRRRLLSSYALFLVKAEAEQQERKRIDAELQCYVEGLLAGQIDATDLPLSRDYLYNRFKARNADLATSLKFAEAACLIWPEWDPPVLEVVFMGQLLIERTQSRAVSRARLSKWVHSLIAKDIDGDLSSRARARSLRLTSSATSRGSVNRCCEVLLNWAMNGLLDEQSLEIVQNFIAEWCRESMSCFELARKLGAEQVLRGLVAGDPMGPVLELLLQDLWGAWVVCSKLSTAELSNDDLSRIMTMMDPLPTTNFENGLGFPFDHEAKRNFLPGQTPASVLPSIYLTQQARGLTWLRSLQGHDAIDPQKLEYLICRLQMTESPRV